jgi:hypothetical protein
MDSFEQDYDAHPISGRTTFYCVFCKESKEFSEHGGQTKEGHDDICQACLAADDAFPPEAEIASLDSCDKQVLRDMIFSNWDTFVTACNGYIDYDPHKLFAKLGGRRDPEDA